MGIKRVFGPAAAGGGGTGDLALTTGGFATRADLNAQNLTASASGGTAGYTYAWTCVRPDGSASTSEFSSTSAQNPTFTPVRVGLYAVTCTVTDSTSGSALSASSTQSKTVGTVLSASISGLANSATLAAQALTATPAGGTGSPTYAWTCTRPDNSSSTSEFSSTTVNNPNFTPASGGLHKVQCIVTDSSSATATAIATADVGTGVISYTRNQLVDLTGWTKFTGASTNTQFATAAAITANSGTFTFGYSNLLDPSGNPDDPAATLNGPKEYGCGYYSPASLLDSVPFDGTPGVLTIRLEQASAGTGTSTAGATVDGKMFVAVGICNGPYNGNDNAVDFYSMLLYTNFAGGNFKPYVSAGSETGSNTTGTTRTASPAGTGIVDLHIMINRSGNPMAAVNFAHYGTTSFARDTSTSASGTDQFVVTDDTRMWVALGSHSTSTAQSASQDFKIFWSYSRIGA